MENSFGPIHDLSESASGAKTNSKTVYTHGRDNLTPRNISKANRNYLKQNFDTNANKIKSVTLTFSFQQHKNDANYGKYPKNANTKASDKMTYANSVDPDQTAPEGAVWSGSTLFAIPLNI